MVTKTCAMCKEKKPVGEFNWRWKQKGLYQSYCRSCAKIRRARHYQKYKEREKERTRKINRIAKKCAKAFVWEFLLANPCVKCGESDPLVLEFDHVRGKKKLEVSIMAGQGYSITAIKREIAKCQVLCANCHRRKTAKERGWYQG